MANRKQIKLTEQEKILFEEKLKKFKDVSISDLRSIEQNASEESVSNEINDGLFEISERLSALIDKELQNYSNETRNKFKLKLIQIIRSSFQREITVKINTARASALRRQANIDGHLKNYTDAINAILSVGKKNILKKYKDDDNKILKETGYLEFLISEHRTYRKEIFEYIKNADNPLKVKKSFFNNLIKTAKYLIKKSFEDRRTEILGAKYLPIILEDLESIRDVIENDKKAQSAKKAIASFNFYSFKLIKLANKYAV